MIKRLISSSTVDFIFNSDDSLGDNESNLINLSDDPFNFTEDVSDNDVTNSTPLELFLVSLKKKFFFEK